MAEFFEEVSWHREEGPRSCAMSALKAEGPPLACSSAVSHFRAHCSAVSKHGDLGFTTCPFDLVRVSDELGSFQTKNRQTGSIRVTLLSTFPRGSEGWWWLSLPDAAGTAGSVNRSRAWLNFPSVMCPSAMQTEELGKDTSVWS